MAEKARSGEKREPVACAKGKREQGVTKESEKQSHGGLSAGRR